MPVWLIGWGMWGGVIVDVAGVFIIRVMDYLVLAMERSLEYVSV